MALGLEDARKLIGDPASVAQAIHAVEEQVLALGGRFGDRYLSKAQALAEKMVTGAVTSQNLLRNAQAIAHLYGEGQRPKPEMVSRDLVDAIDRLTTLYAFEKLDPEIRETMRNLMETEQKGMETVTGFLNVVQQMEIERRDRHGTTNHRAANNGWKGYVPALVEEGASLIVADASQHEHLVRRGYVRIGDYQGDARERFAGPRSYYQSTVGGKAQFRQGVAQTVHETWQGVDARTGATTQGW